MRPEAEIKDRLRKILVQEFDARVQKSFSRLPRSCTHNHLHPLDTRRVVGDDGAPNGSYNRITQDGRLPVVQTIGLCMYGSASAADDWNGTICEDPIDAKRCPYFTPKVTKAQLLEEFREQIRNPAWVQASMPEASALMWALGQPTGGLRFLAPIDLPWWRRLLYWLWPTKVEEQSAPFDLERLLPPKKDDGD